MIRGRDEMLAWIVRRRQIFARGNRPFVPPVSPGTGNSPAQFFAYRSQSACLPADVTVDIGVDQIFARNLVSLEPRSEFFQLRARISDKARQIAGRSRVRLQPSEAHRRDSGRDLRE